VPQPLYGIAIAAISVVLAVIEPRLDLLISPLDPTGRQLENLLRDLDGQEEDSANWVLLPFLKQLAPEIDILPAQDFRRLRADYNYNIAQIEVARFSARGFDIAKRNLHRFVITGLLVFVVMGLVVALLPDELVPVVVASSVFFFAGLMLAAGYAYFLMRGDREQYRGVIIGLRGRLSGQAQRRVGLSPPPGEEVDHIE